MLLANAGLAGHSAEAIPDPFWVAPFVLLLLSIAVLPLVRTTEHWWHHNRNKLMVAGGLGLLTLVYYFQRPFGFHTDPGMPSVLTVLDHALLDEYIPFISLLFSLYVISGGISVRGDIPAHPRTNVTFLAIGGFLASIIGTTGASMLLIRPVLKTNSERKYVVHTVIFFIFVVSNIGGTLLPIGDPPLFLGYLKGVPFLWTLNLWAEWATALGVVLAIYWLWDMRLYRKEALADITLDETAVQPISIIGKINFLWLLGVVFATGTLDPTKEFLSSGWTPFPYLREGLQLACVGLSLLTTPSGLRKENDFNYSAILEVACLFIGIFVCMQVPIEILNIKGASLGIDTPAKFFWASGTLSSFLDNAPTYVVFFETANALTQVHTPPDTLKLVTGQIIRVDHLTGISLGSVFMGAMTYIGNGPNFMVKSIAEHAGVKMPSFFGYMIYSICILIPVFVLINVLFLM